MQTVLLVLSGTAVLIVASLALRRRADRRADRAEMARLLATPVAEPDRFDPVVLAGLPEPARRYLAHAILPGTELRRTAEIEMTGRFGLGDRAAPKYLAMRASQVLAVPEGFVWRMRAGSGAMRISGSDSGRWTRFWLMGLLPVARSGGSSDHRRSAFARAAAEAVFWTPAALLPGPGVAWEAAGPDRARVTLTFGDLSQCVTLTVGPGGEARAVEMARWSNANPAKTWRLQPFGGTLSEEREFSGFRVPTRVEAGNFFGTDDYFPFFIAEVTAMRFH